MGILTEMAKELRAELQNLREEIRALKEQVANYSVWPPLATDHPHIVRIRGVHGGEPIVRGAYVTVQGIVELTRLGQTPAQIMAEHEPVLSLAQVHDALSYYYDHQAEIESLIQEEQAALARATKLSNEISKRRKSARRTARAKKVAHNGRR